jgi:hypothetical protein
MAPDYYGVLGVGEDASRQQIRRAYLSLIRRVHPDRNALPDAAVRAAKLNEAYEILSDPAKRAMHDARLSAGRLSAHPGPSVAAAAAVREKPSDLSLWVHAVIVGGLVLCVLLVFVYVTASGRATDPPAEATTPPAWSRVAGLVEKLKDIVSARASVAGTHTEGAVIVTDYTLDRSKFDARELDDIAARIRQELDESPGADGFMAHAYFNARLLAISVDALARLDRGESISKQVADVRALGDLDSVHVWLERSQFAQPYRDLVNRLDRYADQHATGRSSAELAADLKSKDAVLARVRTQMGGHKLSGNLDAYNSSVAAYNQLADETNAMAKILVSRAKVAEELDLAFNRALDPAMVFGTPGR